MTIATFPTALDAHLLAMRLDEHDIFHVIADEQLVSAWMSVGAGGVKVQVRPEDVERAGEVLRSAPVDDANNLPRPAAPAPDNGENLPRPALPPADASEAEPPQQFRRPGLWTRWWTKRRD